MRERGASPSKGEIKPTRSQLAAAGVLYYLDVKKAAKPEARQYAKEMHSPLWGRRRFRKATERQLVRALSEESAPVGQAQPESPPAREEVLFDRVSLQEIKPERKEPSKLGKFRRSEIALRAIGKVGGLPPDQREKLLEITGFSKEEAKTVGKKILSSSLLGAGTGWVALAGTYFLTAYEKLYPIIQHVNVGEIVASYIALLGSTALAAKTNKPLLDEPLIKKCANGFAAAGYYILPKFFSEESEKVKEKADKSRIRMRTIGFKRPKLFSKKEKDKKEKVETWGVRVGTFGPALGSEFFKWGVIGSFVGLQGILGNNTGSTLADLATVAGNVTWLHAARWNARRKERKVQNEK